MIPASVVIVKHNVSLQVTFSMPRMTRRIVIKLREAMIAYKRRTGERMTYTALAERTGIAQGTLRNMGSQPGYNATISTLTKICLALNVTPADLLELVEEAPKRMPKAAAKRRPMRKPGR